jgi:hypothetical protein
MTCAQNKCHFTKTPLTFWFFTTEVLASEIKNRFFPIEWEAGRARARAPAGPPWPHAAVPRAAALPPASLSSYRRPPARITANRPPAGLPGSPTISLRQARTLAPPASRSSSFRPPDRAPDGLPLSSYCQPCPCARDCAFASPSQCCQVHAKSGDQNPAAPPPESRRRSLLQFSSVKNKVQEIIFRNFSEIQ